MDVQKTGRLIAQVRKERGKKRYWRVILVLLAAAGVLIGRPIPPT